MSNDILESVSQRGFHKEAMERTMRKIEESKKSPMNSKDFADYMRRNLEQAKKIEAASK